MQLSILIPLGPDEEFPAELVGSLAEMALSFEVIVCATNEFLNSGEIPKYVRFVKAEVLGRTHQLNQLAAEASGDWLWFVHADTKISKKVLDSLTTMLRSNRSDCVAYFSLKFYGARHYLCTLNAIGANIRSRFARIPFGDQALLVPKTTFQNVGPYPSRFLSGEDHAWVQKARRLGIPFIQLPATVETSARKYMRNGWINTTLKHIRLTILQEWFG